MWYANGTFLSALGDRVPEQSRICQERQGKFLHAGPAVSSHCLCLSFHHLVCHLLLLIIVVCCLSVRNLILPKQENITTLITFLHQLPGRKRVLCLLLFSLSLSEDATHYIGSHHCPIWIAAHSLCRSILWKWGWGHVRGTAGKEKENTGHRAPVFMMRQVRELWHNTVWYKLFYLSPENRLDSQRETGRRRRILHQVHEKIW